MTTPLAAPPPARRRPPPAARTLLWVLALGLALAGVVATVVRPVAPAVPVVTTDLATFAPEVLAAVDRWVGPVRVGFVLRTLVELAVPAALLSTRRGRALLDRIGGRTLPTVRAAAGVVVLTSLVAAPITAWISWWHAGRTGLRTSSAARFVTEAAGTVALRAVLVGVGVAVLLGVVRRFPRSWPPVVTVLATIAAVVLLLVEPLVTTQLLYDPEPLDPADTPAAVTEVIARSGLDDVPVVVGRASVRTPAVNAYVTGAGPTSRIVLWDTLLERPPEQVAAVVAHELAHAEQHDPTRGVLATAAAVLPLALLGRAALRGRRPRLVGARAGAAAVLALVVVQLVAAPVVTWQSRRVEASADARALQLTRDPGRAVAVARGFVVGSLSDPTPPRWVVALGGSHPTPTQRIERAVAFARAQGLELPTLAQLREDEVLLGGGDDR